MQSFSQNKNLLDQALKLSFYLLIFFLPTQLGKHFWPRGVLASGLRVDYLSPTIYLSDLLLVLFLSLFLAKLIWQKNLSKFITKPLYLVVLLFLAWNLTQLLWVEFKLSHLFFSFRFFLILSWVVVLSSFVWQKKIISLIFTSQLLLLSLLSLNQFIIQKNIGSWLYWLGERQFQITAPGIAVVQLLGRVWLRPYATFSHPNVLAGYVLILILWLYLFGNKQGIPNQIIRWLGIGGGILILIITFSQAAWLGLVLSILLILALKKDQLKTFFQNQKTLILGMSLGLSLLIPFILLLLPSSYLNIDIILRNQLFIVFWQALPRSFFWGWGWGGFFSKLLEFGRITLTRAWLQPVHHSWWLTIASLGIISPMIALKFLDIKKINLKCLVIILTILLLGSFDHYWITQPQTLLLLAFITGVSVNKKTC